MATREYDFVLLGATGYTGKLTAEHIVTSLPTDIKWAIAGRSASKLAELLGQIKPLNPDRKQPEIEPVQLNVDELTVLAKKTKIVLNCIGPYHLYSFPVVEACAKSGTHYLDVTGETPFVRKVIDDFEETAKANGALIIPEVGFDSSPSDLTAFLLVSLLREKYSVGTKEIIGCVDELINDGPSAGSLATVLAMIQSFGLAGLAKLTSPYSISPLSPKPRPQIPFLTKLLGIRTVPVLGTLTTSILAACNVCTVHRSSGQMAQLYGSKFHYAEYAKARNRATGLLNHFGITFGMLLLAFPPSRWLLKKLIHQSGSGPTSGVVKMERFDMRAIATADQPGNEKPKQALGRFAYEGSLYRLTGLLLAEAAMVILKDEEALVKGIGGGVFTPAMLGNAYVERVQNAGCVVEAKLMDG